MPLQKMMSGERLITVARRILICAGPMLNRPKRTQVKPFLPQSILVHQIFIVIQLLRQTRRFNQRCNPTFPGLNVLLELPFHLLWVLRIRKIPQTGL